MLCYYLSFLLRLKKDKNFCSIFSPNINPNTIIATVAKAIAIQPYIEICIAELPMAADTNMPHGFDSKRIMANLEVRIEVRPAKIQMISSGKNGSRNVRKRKVSRFESMIFRYFSAIFLDTNCCAK